MRLDVPSALALSFAAAICVCVEDADRPTISTSSVDAAIERASERLNEMALLDAPELFPVKPDPLRAEAPSRIRVRGLPRAVFAIGADEASLAWLAANAQGLLVAADSEDALRRVRDFAARLGLAVDPMPGAALATAFGAASYPFVAEPSE